VREEYEDILKNYLQKGGRGITKNVYLHFYYEVQDIVETQPPTPINNLIDELSDDEDGL
jgi:hypothetical protein